MKKIFFILLVCSGSSYVHAQNNIATPMGVYGPLYAATTSISNDGNIQVGDGGNWILGGNIISVDKGNDNTPNATGRSEAITFSGTGTYSNAATVSGASGNVIDGYAGVSNMASTFVLPVGVGNLAYPVTVPASVSLHAAYFSGSGSVENKEVNNLAATEYSPFIDVDALSAGAYIFSYPAGFFFTPSSYLLESGNSSAAGTNGSTMYNLLSSTGVFNALAGTSPATVTASYGATQVYFGTSNSVLRVNLLNFKGALNNDKVTLTWNTASEVNNKGFGIERSTDGLSFHNIGFKPTAVAGGNSSAMLAYTFQDVNPVQGVINYYRLVQTDLDGHTTYSRNNIQVKVTTAFGLALQAYPNPTHGSITVSGLSVGNTVQIISINGQKVGEIKAATTTQKIDISTLSAGVYLLNETLKSGETKSIKFIVK